MEINATSELIDILMHNNRTVESNGIRTSEMRELTNLRNAAEVFSEESFRDIRKICEKSESRGLKAKLNGVTIMLYSMAGRIMVTLNNDNTNDSVTLLGGEEDSPRSNQMAGLHTMFGDTDKALDMLEMATHFWYKFHNDKSTLFVEDKEVKIAGM